MSTESLKATEAECAEGRTAPRVSLADLEANITAEVYFTVGDALDALSYDGKLEAPRLDLDNLPNMHILTVCVLGTRNGFTLIGKSAPASPENFDVELGRKLAYEDAVRQLWPLMGYALRERLSQEN